MSHQRRVGARDVLRVLLPERSGGYRLIQVLAGPDSSSQPTTRPITGRKGHGTDRRLEHVPEAQEEVAGDHVIAAVTAAFAPPKNPKAEAPLVDEQFVAGNPGGPGRPPGSRNAFPRGSKEIMNGLLSGELRDSDSGETAGLKLAQLIMDGLAGKVYQERIAPDGSITKVSVSPAVFAKMLLDRSEHEEALEAAKTKEKGTAGGGIRILLPNPVVDPLLKPGQKPRPLRLLGQDPSKPLPDATGTATDAQPSPGPVQTHVDGARPAKCPVDTSGHHVAVSAAEQQPSPAPAPNSEDAFDPAELIEDFEHPICQICMGTGMVRGENGINMVHVRLLRRRGPGAGPGVGPDAYPPSGA